MKAFLKQVLAVIVGSLIVSVVSSVVGFMILAAMVSVDAQAPQVKNGTVLRLNLAGIIEERSASNPVMKMLGQTAETQGLDDILRAIRVAAADDRVAGIYVEGGMVSADFATLEEIRKALTDFKKTGKFILSYGENYTQGSYYVASVADSVLINPSGMLDWHGIASAPMFYKDLLDKVGVKMQVFRVGTYKSYVEPYTRNDMSDANREQVQSFIDDIWTVIAKDVSASRGISIDSLNACADNYSAFASSADYVDSRLVDATAYADDVRDALRRWAGVDKLNMLDAAELAKCDEPEHGSDGEVAVYYAYGNIVGSETEGALGSSNMIVGPQVVDDLDRLANDDDVRAVVLRINSGGGSAFASEQMWHAVQKLREKKPVVVSMSGMAASGGYYMSCGADCIIAEPTTLTGSIGIFGMIPDAGELLNDKIGIHTDVVKTNEASDFGTLGRPMNEGECRALQGYVDRGYRLFLSRVAEGRKMTTAQVDSIAQGRVWTGRQALSLGLVDKLGTLEDAVAEAARRAQISDYGTGYYPAPAGWFTSLFGGVSDDYFENRLRATLGVYYRPLSFISTLRGTDCIQARIAFDPNLN